MNILVTGASGFIGKNLIIELLKKKHTVIATDIIESKFPEGVQFIHSDLNDFPIVEGIDSVIHLAWQGLPNYESPKHIENLEPQLKFLKQIWNAGIKNITVTGTCLEYGMREGMLNEDFPCRPKVYYGVVKNMLREKLEIEGINIKWARLFYVYAKDKGILKALNENKNEVFKVSDTSKDFISIENTCEYLEKICSSPRAKGIYNVGSGYAKKVSSFAREYIIENNLDFEIEKGFPIKFYETKRSWGDNHKIKLL